MLTVILVIHLLLAIAMVGVILLQRSEGGALGIGGGGGGFMTGRQAGNLLTRTTAILATGFMITSLVLALMAGGGKAPRKSILDEAGPAPTMPAIPAPGGLSPGPAAPEAPAAAPAAPAAPTAPSASPAAPTAPSAAPAPPVAGTGK